LKKEHVYFARMSDYIPVFNYDNAEKWAEASAKRVTDYWWTVDKYGYQKRIIFLEHCIVELKKQLNNYDNRD
jgi:hypothetical protein